MAIAYILLFCLGALILQSEQPIYFLFLTVYGLDSVWTILRRLYLGENIFQAHRSHLYQFLANEAGVNKLIVSASYALIQFLIGLAVIECAGRSTSEQWLFTALLLGGGSVVYLLLKTWLIRKFG